MMNYSEQDCLEAIKQMTCNNEKRDAAIASKYESVCLEAVKRITNDNDIRDVAMACKYESVCLEAVKILKNDNDRRVVEEKLKENYPVISKRAEHEKVENKN